MTPVVNHNVCLKPATSESVCVSTGTLLLACFAPQKGSQQSIRAIGVEFIALFFFARVATPCSLQLRERSFAVASGSLRGDILGKEWVNRVSTRSGSLALYSDGRSSALMRSCSCHLEKPLRADHITLEIAEQRGVPSHGPDVFLLCQRELLVS